MCIFQVPDPDETPRERELRILVRRDYIERAVIQYIIDDFFKRTSFSPEKEYVQILPSDFMLFKMILNREGFEIKD